MKLSKTRIVDFAVKENLLGGYFARKKMEVLSWGSGALPPSKSKSLHEFDKDEYDRHRREEGREEGITQGREEGITQGEERKAHSAARAMLADNMPPALVSRYTGLTQDEVIALQ